MRPPTPMHATANKNPAGLQSRNRAMDALPTIFHLREKTPFFSSARTTSVGVRRNRAQDSAQQSYRRRVFCGPAHARAHLFIYFSVLVEHVSVDDLVRLRPLELVWPRCRQRIGSFAYSGARTAEETTPKIASTRPLPVDSSDQSGANSTARPVLLRVFHSNLADVFTARKADHIDDAHVTCDCDQPLYEEALDEASTPVLGRA